MSATTDALLEVIIDEELASYVCDSAGGVEALVDRVKARVQDAAADLARVLDWSAKLNIEDLIVLNGPDANTGTMLARDKWTCMLVAAGQRIDYFLARKWDFTRALDSCIRAGYLLPAKAVLESMPVPPTPQDVANMLCTAIQYGHMHVLQWLRAEYGDIIDDCMRNGLAHVVAAGWCKLDMLQYLHENWGPVPRQYIRQAFYTAAVNDCVSVMDWCLATDPNGIKTTSLFDTAHDDVKERGCASAMQWFEQHQS